MISETLNNLYKRKEKAEALSPEQLKKYKREYETLVNKIWAFECVEKKFNVEEMKEKILNTFRIVLENEKFNCSGLDDIRMNNKELYLEYYSAESGLENSLNKNNVFEVERRIKEYLDVVDKIIELRRQIYLKKVEQTKIERI
ncbi:MAG: hypothetical protein RR662_03900 [Clostridia bacterium]